MLYVTTKDQKDAYTAHKTLVSDCASDGGLYIPYKLPQYTTEQIAQLKDQSFGEVVAHILNQFFSAQLTGWDVDFAIGRNPVKTVSMSRKILVSEVWHNTEASYSGLENNLFRKLSQNGGIAVAPTDWAKTAIKIAVLFGVFADMRQNDIIDSEQPFDLAMEVGEYFTPLAAIYAKKMGLPIGKIICCCSSENAAAWDLINRNDLSTSTLPSKTRLGLERLINAVYGEDEMRRFSTVCDSKRVYSVDENEEIRLSDDIFCVVVGEERLGSVINSVYRTNNYLIDENTALTFGAIQDYRSKVGESTPTLLFAQRDPAASVNAILKATGMSKDAFYKLIK